MLETRLRRLSELSPAMQVLTSKLVRFALITLAVVFALGSVGIDLIALAVFSGAVGVGIGLGLQKVVSNLVSGIILLVDRSIKPGDVIEMEGTYGWITSLNARYVSLATRDGKELLIPNEDLITGRVTNWSYSSDFIRQSVHVGISLWMNRHSPDSGGFAARIALFTGLGNGNSPLPRAKGDRGLRLTHSDAEARPICLFHDIPLLPRHTSPSDVPGACPPSASHAGAGGARSRAISDRMSANIPRGTATSASSKVT